MAEGQPWTLSLNMCPACHLQGNLTKILGRHCFGTRMKLGLELSTESAECPIIRGNEECEWEEMMLWRGTEGVCMKVSSVRISSRAWNVKEMSNKLPVISKAECRNQRIWKIFALSYPQSLSDSWSRPITSWQPRRAVCGKAVVCSKSVAWDQSDPLYQSLQLYVEQLENVTQVMQVCFP